MGWTIWVPRPAFAPVLGLVLVEVELHAAATMPTASRPAPHFDVRLMRRICCEILLVSNSVFLCAHRLAGFPAVFSRRPALNQGLRPFWGAPLHAANGPGSSGQGGGAPTRRLVCRRLAGHQMQKQQVGRVALAPGPSHGSARDGDRPGRWASHIIPPLSVLRVLGHKVTTCKIAFQGNIAQGCCHRVPRKCWHPGRFLCTPRPWGLICPFLSGCTMSIEPRHPGCAARIRTYRARRVMAGQVRVVFVILS